MRSRSCTRSRIPSAGPPMLPGRGSCPGCMRGSSGSGIAPSPAAADEAGIAEHPRSQLAMTGPCRQGPERRGHLRALLWPAQDLIDTPYRGDYALARAPGRRDRPKSACGAAMTPPPSRRRSPGRTSTSSRTITPALRRWKPRRRRTAPRRVTEAAQEIAALKRAARGAGTRAGSARGRASGRPDVADDAGTVQVVLALPSLDGYRLQPGGDPGLAVCADDSVGVPVGDICRDSCYGQHGCCGGEADGVVDTARHGYVPVIVVQRAAVGAAHAAGALPILPCDATAPIEQISGRVKPGSGHGLLLRDRLGGIWEGRIQLVVATVL
jgi:hypothetical protein